MNRPSVYTLGRLIVDLYAQEIGAPLEEVASFRKYLGGSAANTAVGLARHGAAAGLVSRVGADAHGTFLLRVLEREGVDTAMVRRDPLYPTGLAFAALRPPSDSTVLFYRKPCADANIALSDLDETAMKEARMLVVACTALAVSPGREAALAALEMNRASGGVNVLDIDWRPIFWPSLEEARLVYRMAMRMADVVLANEPELEFAGGAVDPHEASRAVRALGPAQVVAKRGGDGVLYFGPEGEYSIPAYPVDVMNTLGAGDGFGAAYAFGLLEGWPVEKRLAYAAASGAIVVSRHSCSEAMPTRRETESLMADAAAKRGE